MDNQEQHPSIPMTYSYMTENNTLAILPLNTAGYISSLILSLPTNSYVIWLIVSGQGKGVATEFFSLNLSVCEIFLCLQSVVILLSPTFPSLTLVVAILTGFFFAGRPLFQCLICVDCYLAVVHPVTFLKYKPLRYKVMCSAAAWIMVVISCGVASVGVIPSLFYLFTFCCLCQAFFIFSIKLFCCLAVLRALKQSGPGERGREREEENHTKRKAFNIILVIITSTLLVYVAYVLAAVTYLLTYRIIVTLWSVGQVCFVLGGLVQPFLYLHRSGKLSCQAP